MQAKVQRLTLWGAIATLAVLALVWAFRPKAILVDVSVVERGEVEVSVTDEGKTRVHDVYVVSAPVNGRLRRIELDVGDTVIGQQTVVAGIEPLDPDFLDPRSEAQAKAAIQAAHSAEEYASEQVNQAQVEVDFADTELHRIRTLYNQSIATQHELDTAERNYKAAKTTLATARAALQMRIFERERAQAQLMAPDISNHNPALCACLNIVAPIDGTVLRLLSQSEGVVAAGAPLIEVGDPADLEVVVALLSMDAVKVKNGMPVRLDNWGGDTPLWGEVARVEPFGFTKVSALGIEEQRVNVIVRITSDYEIWRHLGHGYQVDVSVITQRQSDALRIPVSAVFKHNQRPAVYVVNNGIAALRLIETGLRNTQYVQVVSGLKEQESVVTHPDERLQSGVNIQIR